MTYDFNYFYRLKGQHFLKFFTTTHLHTIIHETCFVLNVFVLKINLKKFDILLFKNIIYDTLT